MKSSYKPSSFVYLKSVSYASSVAPPMLRSMSRLSRRLTETSPNLFAKAACERISTTGSMLIDLRLSSTRRYSAVGRNVYTRICPSQRQGARGADSECIAALKSRDWPGNVRELRNVIERAVIVSPGPLLTVADLCPNAQTRLAARAETATPQSGLPVGKALKVVEHDLILQTLELVKGNRLRAAGDPRDQSKDSVQQARTLSVGWGECAEPLHKYSAALNGNLSVGLSDKLTFLNRLFRRTIPVSESRDDRRAQFINIFRSIADAVLLLDSNGTVRFCNEEALARF